MPGAPTVAVDPGMSILIPDSRFQIPEFLRYMTHIPKSGIWNLESGIKWGINHLSFASPSGSLNSGFSEAED
jgi:hypothetical protein